MALSDHPMWRRPRHHLDVESPSDHVHWIELFYDLIHVVVIFLLGNYLSHHHDLHGFFVFAGMFAAIWLAWGDSSAFNSLYISTDIYHRVLMALQICTVMVIAASIPSMPNEGWRFFALGYAANRAITGFLYYRARKTNESTATIAGETSRNFFAFAVLFAVSAFLPKPLAYWVFGAGVVGVQFMYMLPKIGVMRHEQFRPRIGHLSERFALLMLIVLGEGFFKLVITLSEKGPEAVSLDILFNFVYGGISIFVLCWIYFDFVGNGKPKNNTTRTLVSWWLAHFVLMLAGIVIGVAMAGQVKVHLWEPFAHYYAAMGGLGLAAYILALHVIQRLIEPRESHTFAVWPVRLFGVFMGGLVYLFGPYVPSALTMVFFGLGLFSQMAWPLYKGAKKIAAEPAKDAKH